MKEVWDKATGLSLDPAAVEKARSEEMDFMAQLGVAEESTLEECLALTGYAPVPTQWVDTNKGDEASPDIRSRLVAMETPYRSTIDQNGWAATFAETPPLEAFRLQMSMAMTGERPANEDDELVVGLLDISWAHFHSELGRVVFIKIGDKVYRLRRAMYGLKDANAAFDKMSAKAALAMGCNIGTFTHCVLRRGTLTAQRHGDDYPVLGTRREVKQFTEDLSKHFLVKTRAVLGPPPEAGDVGETTYLNRIVRWINKKQFPKDSGEERIDIEADPRHAHILVAEAGLTGTEAKSLGTPGVKTSVEEDEEVIDDESRTSRFRSSTMRLGYLAQDRPECQFASKELARMLSKPTASAEGALKRVCRFLHGAGRCVWSFPRQHRQSYIDGYSDTDWAGCVRTRRSTSCSMLFHGQHLIGCSSTTQNLVALSSGEAEYYGLVKTASRMLGLQALGVYFGLQVSVRIHVDSTACKGIASRRGVGKSRHLHVQVLWVQKAFEEGKFQVFKVKGTESCSDLGTKHLAVRELLECLRWTGLRLEKGQSAIALCAAV